MTKAKKYQIRVKNASDGGGYWLLSYVWTSKECTQKIVDIINEDDPTREAEVVECK